MRDKKPRRPETRKTPKASFVDIDETPQPTVTVVSQPPPAPRLRARLAPRRIISRPAPVEAEIDAPPPSSQRWKPWSPKRTMAVALAFGLLMTAGVLVRRGTGPDLHTKATHWLESLMGARSESVLAFGVTAPEPEKEAPKEVPAAERADAHLDRALHSPQIANGFMTIPPSFESADGAYDLMIHFNGNPDLIEESVGLAHVNAVVVILNLGVGSGVYEDLFSDTTMFPEVLRRVQVTMERRGLEHARLRRVALTAWSAGYGAVAKILEQPTLAEQVDSVILLDGIHTGFDYPGGPILERKLVPFELFARRAVEGKTFFLITHTEIPSGRYAGTHVTTDVLLRDVKAERKPGGVKPPMADLKSIIGVVPRDNVVPLEPLTVADKGNFHVRGYAGDQPANHSAHLIQISTIALPSLVEHWATRP